MTKTDKPYYVYALFDPDEKTRFYVGVTNDPERTDDER